MVGYIPATGKQETNPPTLGGHKPALPPVGSIQGSQAPFKKMIKAPFCIFISLSLRASHLTASQTEHITEYRWCENIVKTLNFVARAWFHFTEEMDRRVTDFSFESVMAFMEIEALRPDATYSRIVCLCWLMAIGCKLVGDPFSESETLYLEMFTEACFNKHPPPFHMHQSLCGMLMCCSCALMQKVPTNC